MKQDRAEFQGGVVGDTETPVRGYVAAGVRKVSINNGQQVSDLLLAGAVRPQPSVVLPLLQGHVRSR